MIVGKRSTDFEIHCIDIAIVAVLGGHDAVARLEASVPSLADHTLTGKACVVFALRSGKIATSSAFVWAQGVYQISQTLVARIDEHGPGIFLAFVLHFQVFWLGEKLSQLTFLLD
jgi:hypothetical protein